MLIADQDSALAASANVTAARRNLGGRLAEFRKAAGYTQTELASRIGYSRSTVASVETGHQQHASEDFWRACDRALDAAEVLSTEFSRIMGLITQRQRDTAEADRRARQLRTEAGSSSAIHRTFSAVQPSGLAQDDLELRVLDAHDQQSKQPRTDAILTLVGGYAGSGKTEFAHFLSSVTGWTILDKDTLTRPLAEQLLLNLGGDVDDRHSDLYLARVRPYEYRCLLDAGLENLRSGVPTVLTAPFLAEFADKDWLTRAQNRCAVHGGSLAVVWVACDVASMYDYMSYRGAARDAWKLSHWDDYLKMVHPEFAPPIPHYKVDNRLSGAIALADQAANIARRMRP